MSDENQDDHPSDLAGATEGSSSDAAHTPGRGRRALANVSGIFAGLEVAAIVELIAVFTVILLSSDSTDAGRTRAVVISIILVLAALVPGYVLGTAAFRAVRSRIRAGTNWIAVPAIGIAVVIGSVVLVGVAGPKCRDWRLLNSVGLSLDSKAPAWSPTDSSILFVKSGSCTADLHVVKADGSGNRRLARMPFGEAAGSPSWAPDGTAIAYARQISGGSWVLNANGKANHQIGDRDSIVTGLAWSPDSTKVAVARVSSIDIVDAESGSVTSRFHGVSGGIVVDNMTWSPDGSTVAFVGTHADAGGTSSITAIGVDVTSGDTRVLVSSDGSGATPSVVDLEWLPTGPTLVVAATFNCRRERPLASACQASEGVYAIRNGSDMSQLASGHVGGAGKQLAVSPGGESIAAVFRSGDSRSLVQVPARGGEVLTLTTEPSVISSPSWSPSADAIAYEFQPDPNSAGLRGANVRSPEIRVFELSSRRARTVAVEW